ncbi:MAG: indole-3-glycerol-phosphate synthase [Elusimicrobiota bacterium]|nr:indole-3-glycerol-phosphate synthase [Elusimicrobiota bacterium]
MNNFLKDIINYKKELLKREKKSPEELREAAGSCGIQRRSFKGALSAESTGIIAEIKKSSPSRGKITSKTVTGLARLYENAGADAVSVLCEDKYFSGKIDDLKKVKSVYSGPVLMKDFIISAGQIYTGRAMGADAVLLIKAILSNDDYLKLYTLAESMGMDILVEVHGKRELKEVLKVKKPGVIGVNVRDLNTFEIKKDIHFELAKIIPGGIIKVAESGIKTAADASRLKSAGYDALLVGESIVSSQAPARMIKELKTYDPD